MTSFWRLMLTLYNLLLSLLGLCAIAVAVGYSQPLQLTSEWLSVGQNRIILGGGGFVLTLIGLNLLFLGLKGENQEGILVQDSLNGRVTITIPAIKQLVLRAVRTVEGIREVKPEVRNGKNGVRIDLVVMIGPDYKVPEMTDNVQKKVREMLENIGGLAVDAVQVTVDDMVQKNSPTVRKGNTRG